MTTPTDQVTDDQVTDAATATASRSASPTIRQAPPRSPLPEVFSRPQARDAGYSDEAIRWRLRTGEWVRIRRGWFTTREVWNHARKDPRTFATLQARAVVLSTTGTVISHRSAALVHGLTLLHPAPSHVHITGPRSGRSGITHVRHHAPRRPLVPDEITVVNGLTVTTIGRTLRDIAITSSRHEAVALADEALRRGLIARETLSDSLRTAGAKGLAVDRDADGSSTDLLTSVARLVLAGAVPAPSLGIQLWHAGPAQRRIPMLWADATLAAFPHHDTQGIGATRRAGLRVETYGWHDVLTDPMGFRRRIAHALTHQYTSSRAA